MFLSSSRRLQRADPLLDDRRYGCTCPGVVGRSSQKFQVAAQLLNGVRGLLHRPQGVVVTNGDTFHAPLAGVRVDRDRQQATVARRGPFRAACSSGRDNANWNPSSASRKRPNSASSCFLSPSFEIGLGDRLVDRLLHHPLDRVAFGLAWLNSLRRCRSISRTALGRCSSLSPFARMRFTVVSSSWETSLTRPGIAVSGQTV